MFAGFPAICDQRRRRDLKLPIRRHRIALPCRSVSPGVFTKLPRCIRHRRRFGGFAHAARGAFGSDLLLRYIEIKPALPCRFYFYSGEGGI